MAASVLSGMRKLALALLVVCGCGSAGHSPAPDREPTPAASGARLSLAELQYRLIDDLGAPFYCDPSLYPVARSEDPAAAGEVAALRLQDPARFDAIVRHEHLNAATLSPAEDLHVVRQARELAAVPLTADGPLYRFSYQLVGPPQDHVSGTIDAHGVINVESRSRAPHHLCPI
jgi:hypothetical protein